MSQVSKIILIAEDDPDDVLFFREALNHSGASCELLTVSSGNEILDVLDKLQPKQPDVIILDINMPGMNGLECLEQIRANRYYNGIAVGMFSTSAHEAYVDQAYNRGANFFAVKPPRYSLLIDLVSHLVNHDWHADPARLPSETFVLWK